MSEDPQAMLIEYSQLLTASVAQRAGKLARLLAIAAMSNISGPLSTKDKKQVQALIAKWRDNGYDASEEEGPKQAGVQLRQVVCCQHGHPAVPVGVACNVFGFSLSLKRVARPCWLRCLS